MEAGSHIASNTIHADCVRFCLSLLVLGVLLTFGLHWQPLNRPLNKDRRSSLHHLEKFILLELKQCFKFQPYTI